LDDHPRGSIYGQSQADGGLTQSNKALHIVEENEEDDFSKRYIEINTLIGGKSFGDLALIGSKPRMASIRTIEDTHFAVLSRDDFERSLGQIERKKLNEKISFLRSLPFFQLLTKTSLSKLTY
jgi:CRP-like cAMP-binding protein